MKSLSLKIGLLPKIIISIVLGILFSYFLPTQLVRLFTTFNGLFSGFLDFIVPFVILGLVAPGIAELGKGAGKLLGLTVLIAYGSTVIAGYFSYFTCALTFPTMINVGTGISSLNNVDDSMYAPFFTVDMPPVITVMGALITAFVLGLGLANIKGEYSKNMLIEFREVIMKVITSVIIPFLPLYIFGLFLKMGVVGQVFTILGLFVKVIAVIFVVHVVWLVFQFLVAGIITRKNPFVLLKNMLPAYFTALGTQSSAATIPVTLKQTIKNGVDPDLAGFVVPLCATIHLSGSILKIVACAMALMMLTGMEVNIEIFTGFIFTLGVTMIAAPGVPGGAIMAALGLLSSMLGFDEALLGMMIALYITMDSFGTACNVTGDGAIALVVDKINKKK